MNLQKKSSLIELGGQNLSNYTYSRITSIQSPTKAVPPRPSKEIIESTHRLPLKLSPTKNHHDHLRKNSGAYENDISRTDLNQSKMSIQSKAGEIRPLLGDRSNINVTSPSKIRISYHDSNRNSSANSRSSYSKQIIQTPTKTPVVVKVPPRQIQLERKLKILQGRIGQLHREKQEAVGKLNEQNRKIYHQNTSLKLKVSQLTRKLQKRQPFDSSSKIERTESIYQNQAFDTAQLEIKNLKKEIQQIQSQLTSRTTELNSQISANKDLSLELTRIMEICSNQKEEIAAKEETLNKQKEEIIQLQETNVEVEKKLDQQKNHQNQLASLKLQIEQNEQRYGTILKEYQAKIEEYQNAYNQNQCLIKQLQEQIRVYEENSPIKEEVLEESEVHNNDLSNECQELENNFTRAIKQREEYILSLQSDKEKFEGRIVDLEENIQSLRLSDEEKTQKLENASLLLQKMTQRFQEISERYTQLTQKYEVEKSKMNKSQGFQGRCKKCDQLLKTVLRLNTQLNPRKTC